MVDDQEIICELIADLLSTDGHTVTSAQHGRGALEMFGAGPFDLVITDQSMPQMNGVQLGSAIKARSPGTPVVLLTGFGEDMLAAGTLPPGIDLILSKPVSHAELRRAIFQAMEKVALLASVA